ncbi:gp53-like domain-containing protein [Cetobacterium sp.]
MITGEIIQRGDSGTYSNKQIRTITLPTSFSDTNYIVIAVNMNTTVDNFIYISASC